MCLITLILSDDLLFPVMIKRIIRWFFFVILLCVITYYFLPEKGLPDNIIIDKLEIHKSERKMLAFANGELVRTYTVSLGKAPVGDKEYEGDHKTPEGNYLVDSKNAQSDFYRNLGISYPDKNDLLRAKNNSSLPGGNVKIHAIRNGFGFIGKFQRWWDWTDGCIAVTDWEMDELYRAVPVGTPVVIKP
jgi:murein L,D-transpeptidase YafK